VGNLDVRYTYNRYILVFYEKRRNIMPTPSGSRDGSPTRRDVREHRDDSVGHRPQTGVRDFEEHVRRLADQQHRDNQQSTSITDVGISSFDQELERSKRPGRFREKYQGRVDEELVPANVLEFWVATRIIRTLKDKATLAEIEDSFHLVSSWVDAHPLLFKDSMTGDQRKQLTELHSQALRECRFHRN
jgi:hypothetical protein